MKNVYDNIKALRKERDISQVEMAKWLDMYQANYGKLEKGLTELSVNRLYKIADILGVGVERILATSDDDIFRSDIINFKKGNEELKMKVEKLEDQVKDLKLRASLYDNIERNFKEMYETHFYNFNRIKTEHSHTKWIDSLKNNDETFDSSYFLIFHMNRPVYWMAFEIVGAIRELKLYNAWKRFRYIDYLSFSLSDYTETMGEIEDMNIIHNIDFINEMIDKRVGSGRYTYHTQEVDLVKQDALEELKNRNKN